ncbi:MAG: type II toxin-antitoxin system RelE/ParE family toxin [Cyanobacteria bacterium J06648_10]
MHQVTWLPDALADLDKHFDFLNEKSPTAASRSTRVILSAGASLAKFPKRGTSVQGTQQRKLRVPFGKYGYTLYYRIENQQVFILRVHHGRGNPSQ